MTINPNTPGPSDSSPIIPGAKENTPPRAPNTPPQAAPSSPGGLQGRRVLPGPSAPAGSQMPPAPLVQLRRRRGEGMPRSMVRMGTEATLPISTALQTKGKAVPNKGADIMTVPGREATYQAALDGAHLLAYLNDSKENVVSNVEYGEKFIAMAEATKGFAEKADVTNPDDCHLLNLTGSQWLKCFCPTAGMGRLPAVAVPYSMRRPITDPALLSTLEQKGFRLKPGQTLEDAGYEPKEILDAFRIEVEMPPEFSDLEAACEKPQWNPKWSNLFEPYGPTERKFGVTLKDLTIKDLQDRNFDFQALFGSDPVPANYLDPNTKLDDAFIARLHRNPDPKFRDDVQQIRSDLAKAKGEELRQDLLDMMRFMKENADLHFDPRRPETTGVKTASVQAVSMLGQILHDHICDTRIASRGKLLNEYVQQGLISQGTLTQIEEFDRKGRQNPLLAEVKNQDIKNAIATAITTNPAIKGSVVATLRELRDQKGLAVSDGEISTLADRLIAGYAQRVREIRTTHSLSNPRGRVKGDFNTPAYIKHVITAMRGTEGKDDSVFTMPHGGEDKIVEQAVMDALVADPAINKGLASGPPPKTLLRGGGGLATELINFEDHPEAVLRNLLNDTYSPTLGKGGVSARDVIDAYGGLEHVPAELMTPSRINFDAPLTSDIITVLKQQGFANAPETFTGRSADGRVEITIDRDGKMIDCQSKATIVTKEHYDALVAEALLDAEKSLKSNAPILQERKTLRQLGFAGESDLRNAFANSLLPFESILRSLPTGLFVPQEIDLNKGLTSAQIQDLSSRGLTLPISPEDQLLMDFNEFLSLRDAFPPSSSSSTAVSPRDAFVSELKTQIGQTQVPFNDAVRGQTLSLTEFAHKDSVASIMMQNHLRTICSISGTTLDTLVGFSAILPPDELRGLLQPVLEQARRLKNGESDVDALPEETKRLISGIAVFMQGGRYHTLAEVVGGSFIAARALFASEGENINIEETEELFKALMHDLVLHREHYVSHSQTPLSIVDLAAFIGTQSTKEGSEYAPTDTRSHDAPPKSPKGGGLRGKGASSRLRP